MRVALLLVVLAAAALPAAASPAFPGPRTQTIAFWRVGSGGDSGTYVVRADGSQARRVSPLGALAWSPDGRRIAGGFVVGGRCVSAAVVLATGSARRLRDGCGGFGLPSWSPHGDRLAYSAGGRISVVATSGRGAARAITSGRNDQSPAWSPDGRSLLFSMLVAGGRRQVAVSAADGTGVEPLVPLAGASDSSWAADWSPNGQSIVFASTRDEPGVNRGELYTMDLHTLEVRRLTETPGLDDAPRYSPDGTQIAYSHGTGRNGEIWVMRADGTGARRVASNGLFPQWVPAGARTRLPAKIALR
jgi:TolB protein